MDSGNVAEKRNGIRIQQITVVGDVHLLRRSNDLLRFQTITIY